MSNRQCEVCGNEYDKTMQVVLEAGGPHTFDSFECAIQALAPRCDHCGVRILGHGVEGASKMYCSAHCAHLGGVPSAKDRA
jgi:hypothetical protein